MYSEKACLSYNFISWILFAKLYWFEEDLLGSIKLTHGYSAYCGLPAGMEAFRVADRVLAEMEEKGELVRE